MKTQKDSEVILSNRLATIFIFTLFWFTTTNSIYAQNTTKWIYRLNTNDSISLDNILSKCFKDTLSLEDKSTFWDIVNRHGGDPEEVKNIGNIRQSNLVQKKLYMTLFYHDAFASIDFKKPIKSKDRLEAEYNLGKQYSDLFKLNDSLMSLIAKEIPVNYQGTLVLFSKQLIAQTLDNLELSYNLFENNLSYLEAPLQSKVGDYILNFKLSSFKSDFENAKKYIDSAIVLNPNNGCLFFMRGEINFELKQLQFALDDFNRSIELDNLNYEAYNQRGMIESESNLHNQAINDYLISIQINSQNNTAFNNLACQYLMTNDYSKAIENSTKAISVNEYNGITYYNRGLAIYNLQKDYSRVIKDMDSAIYLDQNLTDAYYTRGLCYSFLKNYDKALLDYNKALEISENHLTALINRGILLANLKQFEKACIDFEKAYSLGYVNAKNYIDKICKK